MHLTLKAIVEKNSKEAQMNEKNNGFLIELGLLS